MRKTVLMAILVFASPAASDPAWQRYSNVRSNLGVDFPGSIFTIDAGTTANGYGRLFKTENGESDFSVYSMPNEKAVSPARYFRENFQLAPSAAIYRRISDRFFVASGYRGKKIWYARCNFGGRAMHCVALNYPVHEKRQWDRIVTRVSHSLSSP